MCMQDDDDRSKVYCIGCAPDKQRIKMASDNWISKAYLYMAAMNPDSCRIEKEMGSQRPYKEGPYFPGGDMLWMKSNLVYQLGQDVGSKAWSTFLRGTSYQDINMDEMEET